jgi:hypothetical protein
LFRYRPGGLPGARFMLLVMLRRPAIAVAVLVAALAGCSSAASSSPAPRPAPSSSAASSAASLGCAWYSPMSPPGQVVNVTAVGPACSDRSLVGWLVADSDRPWTSEGVIPGSFGTLVATLKRNGTTVRVWFTGPAPSPTTTGNPPEQTQTATPAAALAGRIADGLEASGWSPVPG